MIYAVHTYHVRGMDEARIKKVTNILYEVIHATYYKDIRVRYVPRMSLRPCPGVVYVPSLGPPPPRYIVTSTKA